MGEERRTLLLRVVISSLCLAALIAIVALLSGDFSDTNARIALTAAAISIYALAAMPGFTAMAGPATRLVGTLAVWFAGGGLALAVLAIWIDLDDGRDLIEPWAVVSIVALALAHASLLLSRRRADDSEAIRRIVGLTLLSDLVVTAISVAAITGDEGDGDGIRVLGAFLVCSALGSALPPIMRRLAGPAAPDPRSPDAMPPELLARALGLDRSDEVRASAFLVATTAIGPLVERARALGAAVLVAPHALPDGRWMAVLSDRDGSPLTLISGSTQRPTTDPPA
jgi:hypothetical protein